MPESTGSPAPAPATAGSGSTETSGVTGAGSVTNPSGGRGNGGRNKGRNRRGNRGRGGRNRAPASGLEGGETQDATVKSTFKGQIDGLEDCACDMINPIDSIDRFESTAERIAEYSATEWTGAALIKEETPSMEEQSHPEPNEPDASPSAWKKKLAEANGLEWIKDMRKLAAFRRRAIGAVWGQCADSARSKVEASPHCKAAKENDRLVGRTTQDAQGNDVEACGPLNLIEDVMCSFQSNKKKSLTILESKMALMAFKQKNRWRRLSISTCYKKFKRHAKAHKRNGGGHGHELGLAKEHLTKTYKVDCGSATTQQMRAAAEASEEQMLAILFLCNADQDYCGELMIDLKNEFSPTVDHCPVTLDAAHQKLVNCTPKHPVRTNDRTNRAPHDSDANRNQQNDRNTGNSEPAGRDIAFTQTDASTTTTAPGTAVTLTLIAGTDGHTHNVKCHGCNQHGLCRTQCPNNNTENNGSRAGSSDGVQLLMNAEFADFSFLNATMLAMPNGIIPPSWILLDNQSTVCCFKDKSFLQNTRPAKESVTIQCNAGNTTTNLIGDLPGFPEPVWHDPQGIANILSLERVEEHCDVTHRNRIFTVHKPDGTTRDLIHANNGLRYWDTQAVPQETPASSHECTMAVSTAANNKSNCSNADYKRAEVARRLQEITGQSLTDYLTTIDQNMIINCPTMRKDVKAAKDIFGPSKLCLQGKTTRRPNPIYRHEIAVIPPQIYDRHKEIHLYIDTFFVNKIPFLVTLSEFIRFISVEHLPNGQQDTIFAALMRVRKIYNLRQFVIKCITADSEFEVLRPDLSDKQIGLTTVADDEHVPQIERCIRTIKERVRLTVSSLPFRILPTRMIIEIILGCVTWLNFLPPADGASKTISPRALITGIRVDYNRHCRIQPGVCAQTHEEHDNSMNARTLGAIALRPTGNSQGSHYFLNLRTGQRICRMRWTELPTPDDVIDRIHTLARRNKAAAKLTFAHGNGDEIFANEDDEDANDPDCDPADDDDSSAGVDDEDEEENDDSSTSTHQSEDDQQVPEQALQIIPEIEEDDVAPEQNEDNNNSVGSESQQPTRISDNDDDDHNSVDAQSIVAGVTEQDDDGPQGDADPNDDDSAHRSDSPGVSDHSSDSPGVVDPIGQPVPAEHMDDVCGARRRDNMRPRKERSYRGHKCANVDSSREHTATQMQSPPDLMNTCPEHMKPPSNFLTKDEQLEHVAMTQCSIKKGLRVFGQSGADAVLKEMRQLDYMDVMEPVVTSSKQWPFLPPE